MKYAEIGARIVEWGKSLVGSDRGWQVRLAERLGVSVSYLQAYTAGRNRPGNVMQSKLRSLGADVEYIMTGISSDDQSLVRRKMDAAREKTRIYFFAPEGVSPEHRKRYEKLAELIARIPPGETERIEAIVRAYLRSVSVEGD